MPAYNIQDIRNDFIFRSERVTHVLLPYVNAFYADADSASYGVFEPLGWKVRNGTKPGMVVLTIVTSAVVSG